MLFEENCSISHYELCKATAERFINDNDVVLFDYQSYSTSEFPDVLCFSRYTTLFEIKVSRQDFLTDSKKTCRIKTKIKYNFSYGSDFLHKMSIYLKKTGLEELIIEAPHLGSRRFYICPKGLIQPEEVDNGWGLYWYNGRFSKKKDSQKFRNNIYWERLILQHAVRKLNSGKAENILVRSY